MSEPSQGDWLALKRLGRYLIGRTRMVIKFNCQTYVKDLVIWTDTDFAGCRRTRKSTNGGVAMIGNHLFSRGALLNQLCHWPYVRQIIMVL